MRDLFTKHPRSMGETYGQHFICATKFGSKMMIGGIVCFIHAIFPFFFQKTGSNMLFQMIHDFIERTPQLEDRAISLSQTLQKKIQQ